jgi:hypothetical protein
MIAFKRPKRPTIQSCSDIECLQFWTNNTTGEQRYFYDYNQVPEGWTRGDPAMTDAAIKTFGGRDVLICGTGPQMLDINLKAAKRAGMMIIGVGGASRCETPDVFDVMLSMHHQPGSIERWRWADAINATIYCQTEQPQLKRPIILFETTRDWSGCLPALIAGGTSVLSAVNLCVIGKARNIWLAGVQMSGRHFYDSQESKGMVYARSINCQWERGIAICKREGIGLYQTTTDTVIKLAVKPLPGSKKWA